MWLTRFSSLHTLIAPSSSTMKLLFSWEVEAAETFLAYSWRSSRVFMLIAWAIWITSGWARTRNNESILEATQLLGLKNLSAQWSHELKQLATPSDNHNLGNRDDDESQMPINICPPREYRRMRYGDLADFERKLQLTTEDRYHETERFIGSFRRNYLWSFAVFDELCCWIQ